MANQSIIASIQGRISELDKELRLLQGALAALTGKAAAKQWRSAAALNGGAARPRVTVAPVGTFNLVRQDVFKLLLKKPRPVNDLIGSLAEKHKVSLTPQAKRVMYARAYQHLLQLEGSGSAKRTPDGWVKLG